MLFSVHNLRRRKTKKASLATVLHVHQVNILFITQQR
jgi:hypothetical protein